MNAEYITKPGDRWDLIAYRAYGTVDKIGLPDGTEVNAISYIIENNPGLTLDSVLQEGLLLEIPIIPNAAVKTASELLPPWKR